MTPSAISSIAPAARLARARLLTPTVLALLASACLVSAWPSNAAAQPRRHTAVTIAGDRFLINGVPTMKGRTWRGHDVEGLLPNARMVQAIFDDLNPDTRARFAYPDTKTWDPARNTREFIAAMAEWRRHGLLAVTLNLQGGSPEGYSQGQPWHNSAFTAEGTLRPEYTARLEAILDEADRLGMAVMLGLFYFGQDDRLRDETAVIRAVDTAVSWILDKGYTNVLIEINNECNIRYDHAILQPARVHELITRVRQTVRGGRRLLASTSYGGNTVPGPEVVAASDFVLLHGNGISNPERIRELVHLTRSVPTYSPKPIVFNEDDHFGFDLPSNNVVAATSARASWGYFDYRMKGEGFDEGYQSVPVNWGISSARKRGFFELVREMSGGGATGPVGIPAAPSLTTRPNIVLIFADDMGYGDLSGYGHPSIRTPRLDQLAAGGIRLTTVYAAPSCTPSRAALMTGRYPTRSGLGSVLMPDATTGMPASEVTLAELLKGAGYDTAMVGKWHMGDRPGFRPTEHGFDQYFGLLYSNDMIPPWVQTTLPRRLVRGTEALPGDVDMHTLTRRYVDEALAVVRAPRERPFFLYLAYSMPHVPIGASPAFAGASPGGRYGDTIEELDAETGRLLDALRERGLDNNTLVIFTSDNGPWAEMPARLLSTDAVRATDAGSAGPFRGSKGSTWEGGVRVPMIVSWPGHVPAGRSSSAMVSTMDVFATVAQAAGVAVPADRPMDSLSQWPLFTGTGSSPRSEFVYFNNGRLEGLRTARWKVRTMPAAAGAANPPQLFDLVNDPYERFDVAGAHTDIVKTLLERAAEAAKTIVR